MPDAPILVTAALPYANGPLHIGHIAGAYLPADLYCRYQRLNGRDLVFVCGSDEHGVPILLRARAEGVSPTEIVDRYHVMMQSAFARFGLSFDHYGRTSAAVHHQTSQDFFRVLAEKDVFVQKTEEQLFDPEANLFLADRFVKGTCPVCGFPDAYGDQCERCGSSLSPKDLINPTSTLSGATPVYRSTSHWYLPLGQMQPTLEDFIAGHPEWKANVLGQVRSWLKEGLSDRAVTRDLPWGVPVPADVATEEAVQGKVLYVWFDAPIGYISATKEWAALQGDPDRWQRYWYRSDDPDQPSPTLIHFIGKDNIVFHCLMFPAMLLAHGRFVVPENVPANEFLNLEGRKLSTSRGWAVWLHEALEAFPPDTMRYAMAGVLPETKDADFSWDDFQTRVNAELADVLGNFVHRTLTFAQRFAGGVVPALENPRPIDTDTLAALSAYPDKIGQAYAGFRFREAVLETMNLARLGNKYFNDTEPWHTRKTDEQAMRNTIHVSLQLCAALSVLMEPVLPFAAADLRDMLRLTGVRTSNPGVDAEATIGWSDAGRSLLPVGHAIGEPSVLFTKIEDAEIAAQKQRLEDRAEVVPTAAPALPERPYADPLPPITIDDVYTLDLRVGEVKVAERVPKADKLLRLVVDLGFETRQILSGIAQHIAPEDLVGKRLVVVANLPPRTMRGLESQGMILTAEERDGTLKVLTTDGEPGSVVK